MPKLHWNISVCAVRQLYIFMSARPLMLPTKVKGKYGRPLYLCVVWNLSVCLGISGLCGFACPMSSWEYILQPWKGIRHRIWGKKTLRTAFVFLSVGRSRKDIWSCQIESFLIWLGFRAVWYITGQQWNHFHITTKKKTEFCFWTCTLFFFLFLFLFLFFSCTRRPIHQERRAQVHTIRPFQPNPVFSRNKVPHNPLRKTCNGYLPRCSFFFFFFFFF